MKAIVDLHAANSKTGTNTKHCAHHREDVHRITHPAVDLITNKWVETGADGHRKAFSVAHEGEKETYHHIHDPSVDAPVKQCQVDGVLCTLVVAVSIWDNAVK